VVIGSSPIAGALFLGSSMVERRSVAAVTGGYVPLHKRTIGRNPCSTRPDDGDAAAPGGCVPGRRWSPGPVPQQASRAAMGCT